MERKAQQKKEIVNDFIKLSSALLGHLSSISGMLFLSGVPL